MFEYFNLFIALMLELLRSLDLLAQGNGIESLRQTSKIFAEVARKVSSSVVLVLFQKHYKSVSRRALSYLTISLTDLFNYHYERFLDHKHHCLVNHYTVK